MVAPARRLIEASPITPLPYTLLSVADVRDDQQRVLFGAEMQTDACRTSVEAPEWCPPEEPDPAPGPKEFVDGLDYTQSVEFVIYSMLRCRLVGADLVEDRASRIAQLAEYEGVEKAFMRDYLASTTPAEVPEDPDVPLAVDVTPAAGAVCPELGVALLEGWMSRNYRGLPTLHLPRTVASLMGQRDQLVQGRGQLETRLASRVAAGAGYDGPNNLGPGETTPTADGEAWLYATGNVIILRGPGFAVRSTLVQPTPGGLYNNEYDTFAERPYSVLTDCAVAAVRVTVDCGEVVAP